MLDVLLPLFLLLALGLALRAAPTLALRTAPSLAKARKLTPAAYHTLSRRSEWVVSRQGLTVSTSTGALNGLPKRAVGCLSMRGKANARRFYDAGVAAGCVGCAGALLGALWALTRAWGAVWEEAEAHAAHSSASRLLRRALPPPQPGPREIHSSNPGLVPLIPGVTTPLVHLPTLVLALVLAQLIHEAGHALAAALDDVAPSKLQFSIHAVVPSASVVFPSSVDYLPTRARARIATSGPWHNLILWGCLLGLGWLSPLLWADYSAQGRVVTSISPTSGLRTSLQPGDLITHLDDVSVGGNRDIWEQYLSSSEPPMQEGGWCVPVEEFGAAPSSPCGHRHLVAFTRVGGEEERCLAPHGVFAEPHARECRCGAQEVCVRLGEAEKILRIRVRKGRRADTVLWSGDRAAVLHAVQVDTSAPRLLGSLTRWGALFLAYFKMASLSLFLFNLLPLPGTDGIQLFTALLSPSRDRPARQLTATPSRHPTINPYRYDSGSDDDDDYAPRYEYSGHRREEVWQRRLRRAVEGATAAVVAGWVLGWAMLALLRSS
ncbi:hypothetical protein CC85DRAFT_287432 [Cutaneotrichosporon oleaginosum]|uniref:Endopeptidase S2P n=1 Tax=Cutaneotrichosporon oleaginosum TaxID=879819 RepID=A0A0J1AYR5_9TREE|nr:uncharacterized protein CC85DRAFT_287432 [Cutaneotrichosporon oleaginosum]KLT40459.1 hypothetical protein CC85DRAFT_287432 [Cutaneotrichosporon oleaginosum]TXT15348.1 hypothetical protein COLE_01541 [Cutaneotrichosporon oleaginosum]